MSYDQIIITYWEGDDVQHTRTGKPQSPFTKMVYAEWTRNGVPQWGFADEEKFDPLAELPEDQTEGANGEVRGIPDDVRETLALLIAPSLRRSS